MNRQQTAVIRMLQKSIQLGLNASLTPTDCRILLDLIGAPYQKKGRIIDRLTDLFLDSVEGFTEEISSERVAHGNEQIRRKSKRKIR